MNAKKAKLLRQGAIKFQLPYKNLKKAFDRLDPIQKDQFIKTAKKEVQA